MVEGLASRLANRGVGCHYVGTARGANHKINRQETFLGTLA